METRRRVQRLHGLLLCVLLGTAVATPAPSIAKPGGERARAVDPSWQTYRNERYAFRLSYPADSQVDTHRERGVQHVSISRAPAAEAGAATAYQVDVLIYDHRLGHKLKS